MSAGRPMYVTGRIVSIERLTNSRNGNPRFRVTLQSRDGMGTWNTAADHAFCYSVGNAGLRAESPVTLTIGGRGTIVAMVAS
jgi:hypothetical protein